MKKLYGVYTPAASASVKSIEKDLKEAIDAGLPWLQIRDKSKDDCFWNLWSEISHYAAQAHTFILVNDSLSLHDHLQQQTSTPVGLHLGQDDTALQTARHKTAPDTIIGLTCHSSVALAQEAIAHNASYVAFGRFFPSKTKPDASPADIQVIEDCFQSMGQIKKPIAVIGGIELDNIQLLKATPASLYAISNGIWGQSSISQAIQNLNAQLQD